MRVSKYTIVSLLQDDYAMIVKVSVRTWMTGVKLS